MLLSKPNKPPVLKQSLEGGSSSHYLETDDEEFVYYHSKEDALKFYQSEYGSKALGGAEPIDKGGAATDETAPLMRGSTATSLGSDEPAQKSLMRRVVLPSLCTLVVLLATAGTLMYILCLATPRINLTDVVEAELDATEIRLAIVFTVGNPNVQKMSTRAFSVELFVEELYPEPGSEMERLGPLEWDERAKVTSRTESTLVKQVIVPLDALRDPERTWAIVSSDRFVARMVGTMRYRSLSFGMTTDIDSWSFGGGEGVTARTS